LGILVDTSVWINFFNGSDSPSVHILEELIVAEEDIVISDLILAEILPGFRKDRDFTAARDHLLGFRICSLKTVESYIKAAQIYRDGRKKGLTIRSTIDCIIAQVAIEHDHAILHQDRDFDRIASIRPLTIYTA